MAKKYQLVYYNFAGQRIILYEGALKDCQRAYNKNIKACEWLSAIIEEYRTQ